MTNKLKNYILLFLAIVVSGAFLFPKMAQAVASGPSTIVGYCQAYNWGSPTRPMFRVHWLDKGGDVHNDYALYRKTSTNGGASYGGWVRIFEGGQVSFTRSGGLIEMGKDVNLSKNYWYQYIVNSRTSGGWVNSTNVTTIPATAAHCGSPSTPDIVVTCEGTPGNRKLTVDWTIATNAKYNIMRRRAAGGSWEQPDRFGNLDPYHIQI